MGCECINENSIEVNSQNEKEKIEFGIEPIKLKKDNNEITKYYAFKEINYKGEKDFKYIKNLLYESSMMVGLFHKNLVKIHSIFLKYNRLYMEYLAGGNLAEIMSKNENLSLDYKIHILLEIADGLIALHNPKEYLNPLGIEHSPIVHGNLNPNNILLTNGNYPNVKITDFALSGIVKEELKDNNLAYSAPNILNDDKILDTRYDVCMN